MIRLYADENVDDRIIRGLRLRGIDILTVFEAGMIGGPSYPMLLLMAKSFLLLIKIF